MVVLTPRAVSLEKLGYRLGFEQIKHESVFVQEHLRDLASER